MKPRISIKWIILLSIAFSFLFGCGGKGKEIKKIEGDPESLYKQGLSQFNKRNYSEALKKFEELKSNFPDSPPYTIWAELKIGDCHFFKKEYVEAIAAYEEFKKIHPGHDEIPYVQYQIGMSYFNQMLTLDRDQTSTKKALSNFEYLIANFPPSIFTEKVKEKISVCKKRLADHEFYIGHFYYRHKKFQAAASRYEGLLEKYPKNPGEDKTLYLLGKSYLELDQWEMAQGAFTRIVNDYPKSSYTKEAQMILNQVTSGTKGPSDQTRAKESKKKGEIAEAGAGWVSLVRFEEEGKRSVFLREERKAELKKEEGRSVPLPIGSESAKSIPPEEESKEMISPMATRPRQEDESQVLPPSIEAPQGEPLPAGEPMKEDRTQIPPSPYPVKTILGKEVNPDEEKRVAALPSPLTLSKEKGEANLLDSTQSIDITSDNVEAYRKENVIIFKGNVIARQRDIVIYADSIEAVIIQDGKGIERVIAGGNVKIQQGLRVASCQKAVFYNIDQKMVLTGDPKVSEGDNLVSGDEIIFDIERNRVEVKGGPSGRGKAKIHPEKEIEKLK